MPPRLCTSCDVPHVTTDWYVIDEHKHPRRGEHECKPAHEDRVRREVRLLVEKPAALSVRSILPFAA